MTTTADRPPPTRLSWVDFIATVAERPRTAGPSTQHIRRRIAVSVHPPHGNRAPRHTFPIGGTQRRAVVVPTRHSTSPDECLEVVPVDGEAGGQNGMCSAVSARSGR